MTMKVMRLRQVVGQESSEGGMAIISSSAAAAAAADDEEVASPFTAPPLLSASGVSSSRFVCKKRCYCISLESNK
jgi:hypothetical protein